MILRSQAQYAIKVIPCKMRNNYGKILNVKCLEIMMIIVITPVIIGHSRLKDEITILVL